MSASKRLDANDPTTWYPREDANRDVGCGLTVATLAERIYEKRLHQKPQPLTSKVCERFGVNWNTVTWEQMLPAIQEDILELCYWLRFTPTPQQQRVLRAVMQGDLRLAVKSGQGPGKTTCSSIIGLWWGLQDLDVRTIVTAPSMKQCRDVWLSEVRTRMVRAHPLLRKFITVTQSRVYFGGFVRGRARRPNWRCELITASTAEAFQGQHNKRLNAIVEEASGVESAIIEALKGTVSNFENEYEEGSAEGAILMIGNPNARDTEFFKCFGRMGRTWLQLTLDAEESPIVNPRKIIEHAIEFGVDSPFYRVRVLGLFPDTDAAGIINADDVAACVDTNVRKAVGNPELRGQKQFGIDLARQGGDETVIYRRSGGCIVEWKKFARSHDFEPAHAIRWAFRKQVDAEWHNWQTLYVFDAGGMGQGVMHLFEDAGKEYFPFHTQHKPTRPMIFKDRMTEAWFQLARLLRERQVRIPDDPILHHQLTSRHYQVTKEGLMLVEPKKDYMKRTGEPSPDRADALVMAFYQSGFSDTRVAAKSAGASAR